MKKKTYTLNVRQTGQYPYEVLKTVYTRAGGEVTVPEIGATKMAATLDSALNITLHEILKHITTRSLILVITDNDADREGPDVYPQACLLTALEHQTAHEIAQLGIAPQVKRREHHLVFEVTQPLTRAQTIWLDEHTGKLFDRYYLKDERDVHLDALLQEAHDHKREAAHE